MRIYLYILIIYRMYIISCCLFLIATGYNLSFILSLIGWFFHPLVSDLGEMKVAQRSLGQWSPRMARRALVFGNLRGMLISDMDVSENNGTPKSSILIIVFHYKPSIFGTPIYGNTHISRKLSFPCNTND